MKKTILICILLLSKVAYAQTDTTIVRHYELSNIESEIDRINSETIRHITAINSKIAEFEESEAILSEKNNLLQTEMKKAEVSINSLKDTLAVYRKQIESNTDIASANSSAIDNNQNRLQTEVNQTNNALDKGKKQLDDNISNISLIGVIAFLLSVILTVILAIILYRRGKTDISKLKQQAESLNVKIVDKLTAEASEMAKLTSVADTSVKTTDHSLIKILADRITFMETTLYRMDSSIRGHKQLSKSIKQMKNNLLANDYEVVEMLGKPYHNGMNASPSFIQDDSLGNGEQIITEVIKPQINYKGVMIQTAEITVSQN